MAATTSSSTGTISRSVSAKGSGTRSGRRFSHLLMIKYREPLQERNRPGIVAARAGADLFGLQRETISIDDGGATLALADAYACFLRLPESEPTLRGMAARDNFDPQDQAFTPE